MRNANRIDQNRKWISDQLHTLDDGEICFIWNEKTERIKQMDIAIQNMQVDRAEGKLYVMYKSKRRV